MRNLYKWYSSPPHLKGETDLFEEVRPEMRALIFFMIGLSLLGIGIILNQAEFAIGYLGP